MAKTIALALLFAGVALLACSDSSSDAVIASSRGGAAGTGSAGGPAGAGGSAGGGQGGQAGGGAAGGDHIGWAGSAGASGGGGACASIAGGATPYKMKGSRYDPAGKCVHALEALPDSICQVQPPPPNTGGITPAIVVSPGGVCYFVDRSTDSGFCADGWQTLAEYFSPFCGGMTPLTPAQSEACGSELLASAPAYKECAD